VFSSITASKLIQTVPLTALNFSTTLLLRRFLIHFLGVNESALRFLAEVSAADGVAVECNQTTISNRLLLNDSMLMLKTEINANNLDIAAKSNNKIQKWESIVDEKDFFEKDGGLIMGKYKAKESVQSRIWKHCS
jgi:hypothetical protein